MHALLEPVMGEKPALEPKTAIGPVMRAVAATILAQGRAAMVDPERSHQDAVHDFRRAMKEWRALMRLLAPFIPDAQRWRHEARDHARSLAHARDGAAALMAFDGLIDKGNLVLSERSSSTIRSRIEALRDSEETGGTHPGAARSASSPGSTPRRRRSRSGRSIPSIFPPSRRSSPRATAMRAIKFRPTGRRPAARTCIRCASASSTCAIRWT